MKTFSRRIIIRGGGLYGGCGLVFIGFRVAVFEAETNKISCLTQSSLLLYKIDTRKDCKGVKRRSRLTYNKWNRLN